MAKNYLDFYENKYKKYFTSVPIDKLKFKVFTIKNNEFLVNHFLDESDISGYGFLVTNENLSSYLSDNEVAIGLLQGDDIICMDVDNGAICLYMIENGDGERLKVADSLEAFLSICTE